jgi:hypothetical protein
MDGQRFDVLARVWATGASRRQALRLLCAGGAATLLMSVGATRAASQDAGTRGCGQDSDCVDPDADPCTGARCEEGACVFTNVACAPGFVCCGNGECCQTTSDGGNQDTTDDGASEDQATGDVASDRGPVSLPNTGSGNAATAAPAPSSAWRMPLALLGAGAALVANRLRRVVAGA